MFLDVPVADPLIEPDRQISRIRLSDKTSRLTWPPNSHLRMAKRENGPGGWQTGTAGVDVQGDRLEVQIIGWAAYEESFAIRYEVLPGDPAQSHVWQLLDHVLSESYHSDTGRELRVRVTCVDTGGHFSHSVHTYCQQRRRRNVFPIKGLAGPRPIWPHRVSRTKDNSHIWMIGVDTAKDAIYGRLRIPVPGPSYMHFPAGGAFDAEYFAQLSSEVVRTRYQQGRPYRVWVLPPGRRNEALDTAAYALAGRHALRIPILLPRPEPRSSSSPPLDDDDDTAPLPEQVDEPETGFDPPGRRNQHASPSAVRREIDPNERHSAFVEATRPQGGWVYGGVRPRGSWFNRG